MWNLPDLTPLFYWGIFGMACAALAILIGVPLLGYWLWQHLAWVS